MRQDAWPEAVCLVEDEIIDNARHHAGEPEGMFTAKEHYRHNKRDGGKRSKWDRPDFPHRGSDLEAFLSIKPRISFAEEFEEVLVLVGQIEDHEPLSWDIEHMNPNKIVKHPPCRGVWNASPFLIWEGRSMLLQGRADAIFERCIDEQTHCHHHQEGHNALGLFEIEGGGQKLRVFEEAKPAFCPRLPFVSIEHGLGC